ncbi:hypothetical protein LU276_08365 [Moraxella haemolytica]|uniref:hypothetical protein n=1 Tax=Moraxella haemolytica TaxID=2904119 RepID=UPI002542D2DE|nr:hypothetical protein [Moraxella sp. ZY171148]WII95014.1 hypothetical protein LU276_08365 [Moraxella sp. ZY171148]
MTQTLTTLNRTEAQILQAFIWQVDTWQSQYGDKANKVEIVYYPEDDGFEVVNGEKDNGVLKRNRTTAFRAEILAWATAQLNQLKGWNNDKTITAFACVYQNGEFGVAVEVTDKTAENVSDEAADSE